MTVEELRGKKVGILGFGVEGKAVASFLHSKGIDMVVFDRKIDLDKSGFESNDFELGVNYLDHISSCDVLFRSPGVRVNESSLKEAKQKGVIVTSQMQFFFENFRGKIIGITGTKGKSTTAKLIHEMLSEAGVKNFLGGNYGQPVLDLLDKCDEEDYAVLELSSFQLQDMTKSPYVAVVLMITSEHLNYHQNEQEYVQAKASLTRYQGKNDVAIINNDYPNSREVGKLGEARKLFVQTLFKEKLEGDPFQVFDPKTYLKIEDGFFAEEVQGTAYFVEHGNLHRFLDSGEIPLRGFHNLQNVGAAALVAKTLNVPETAMKAALHKFRVPPHRLEFVAENEGVKYFDDSISTTPESCLAAVKAFYEPVILILGGDDKKADYEKLAEDLVKINRLKGIVTLGEIGPVLVQGLKKFGFSGTVLEGAKNMAEIVVQAQSLAVEGDVVLLAPGTSSFGMFKDYKDRGEQFKKNVLK